MSRVGGFGRSFALLVALAFLLTTGVPGAFARGPARTKTVIHLGALITMSATGDPDTQVALQLAVEDFNAFFAGRGSRLGRGSHHRVRLTVEGTGLDPDVALEKIELLAVRGLNVVIGPESSAEVEAIKPFTDANDMVLLSHCSTAPSLAIPGDSVYRLVPSDLHQAAAIARLIVRDGKRAIVPMWRAGVWGDDISSAASQQFVELGGTVYPGVRFDPQAVDFSGDLAALTAQVEQARASFGGAVAVAFFGFGTEGAAVLAQAADFPALGAVTWYGSDGTALSREILGDPRAAGFAVQTGFFNTLFADVHTQKADAVRERISAAIGGGSVHFCAMAAYDAVWLAALSAAVVGTRDIDRFKRALVAIADSYEGATGPTTLDAAGDRADAAYDVWAIQEENGQPVWRTVSQTIAGFEGAVGDERTVLRATSAGAALARVNSLAAASAAKHNPRHSPPAEVVPPAGIRTAPPRARPRAASSDGRSRPAASRRA
jgi:branched-chain amino acid transport system substrate-binding protein